MTLKELWHRLGSPRWFYRISGPLAWVLGILALVLLVSGSVWGLAFAPPDYQQGNSFRIIYIHVPSAWMSLFIYMCMAGAGPVGAQGRRFEPGARRGPPRRPWRRRKGRRGSHSAGALPPAR